MPHRNGDGRDRIPWNVLASWGGQFVQMISGFILPRMIDAELGQLQLGIWDFAWSVVTSFMLLQGGVVAAVNRYVAMYRARRDDRNVNCVVNSVACMLSAMSLLIVLLAMVSAWGVGYVLDEQLATARQEARWLVLLLGWRMAVHVAGSVFGGVLTGCHRWDLQNLIHAVTYVIMLMGSVAALRMGQGLMCLALISLCSEVVGSSLRWLVACRVCPALMLHWQYVHWRTARTMLRFGAKSFIPYLGELLLNQAVNIMILVSLGPAALALYARPRALVRHVITLLQKYAFVFAPTVGSLYGRGHQHDVYELAIQASRYGACLSVPLLLLLALSGDDLLHVWMGANYRQSLLVVLLTLGHVAHISFLPLFQILSGMNRHGRPAVVNTLSAGVAFLLVYLALQHVQTGLVGVALAISLPLILSSSYLALYTCRMLGISIGHFLVSSWSAPLACAVPFGLCLVLGKWFYGHSPALALSWGLGVGSLILSVCYWKYIVPEHWKKKLALQILSLVG